MLVANAGPFSKPEHAVGVAQLAEELGFESLWTVEHVVVPSGYESPYPYSPDGRMPGGEDVPIPDPLDLARVRRRGDDAPSARRPAS